MMLNKTNAFMLQTIMILMNRDNVTTESTKSTDTSDTVGMEEICYDKYGCFSIKEPWVTESRPVNMLPQSPDKISVKFPVFTRRNRKVPFILEPGNKKLLRQANLDPKGPFYIVSHGYLESGDKQWIEDLSNALLNLELNNASSVIVVDWRGGSSGPYSQAVANIRLVGAIAGHFVHEIYEVLGLYNLDNFHYIGHSLGAHLGGYCGSTLQEQFGLKLGRITGLDPAEPHFAKTHEIVRLDRSDAQYVDVIHSDAASFLNGGFGILESIGHVDFFPNGGSRQPGCTNGLDHSIKLNGGSLFRGFSKYLSCNHIRSYQFFTESISPSCPFFAVECNSFEGFLNGECSQCDMDHFCIPFGYHSYPVYKRLYDNGLVDPNNSLNLYTITGDNKPFCRVHYKLTIKFSEDSKDNEIGRLWITLLREDGYKSERVPIDSKLETYHKPGSTLTVVLPVPGVGFAPASAILEWEHNVEFFIPSSWQLFSSSNIHIDWVKIKSLEYNSELTVCSKDKRPIFKGKEKFTSEYCKEK